MSTKMDLKLIPEFGGGGEQLVVGWLHKVKLVCKLFGVTELASIIPLCLSNGVFF